jgi:hypothetical protein
MFDHFKSFTLKQTTPEDFEVRLLEFDRGGWGRMTKYGRAEAAQSPRLCLFMLCTHTARTHVHGGFDLDYFDNLQGDVVLRIAARRFTSEALNVFVSWNKEAAGVHASMLLLSVRLAWGESAVWPDTPTQHGALSLPTVSDEDKRGIKLGTAERVAEFHRLVKSGMSHREAKKRAHSDPSTYYRWCEEVTGEKPIESYR